MNVSTVLTWAWENREMITLIALVGTALGAIYQPTRDFLKALPYAILSLVKLTLQFVWFIVWPIRKLVAWTYTKFLSIHVDNFFNRIFDWLEMRNTAKEKLGDSKDIIRVTDL
jgi:hypothetical protein